MRNPLIIIGLLLVLCLPMAEAKILGIEAGTDSGNMRVVDEQFQVEGGERLRLSVRVLNDGNDTYSSLRLRARIDDLDIEELSASENVAATERERFEVTLLLPERLDDETYALDLRLEDGEDVALLERTITLEHLRGDHDIHIVSADVFPQEVLCGDDVRISVLVYNRGTNDEGPIRLLSESEDLGHSAFSDEFMLREGREVTEKISLHVPKGILEGDYDVRLLPRYRFGDATDDAKSVKVRVKCAASHNMVTGASTKQIAAAAKPVLMQQAKQSPITSAQVIRLDKAVTKDTAKEPLEVFVLHYAYELVITSALLLSLVLAIFLIVLLE